MLASLPRTAMPSRWTRDRHLWAAIAVALVLRALPLVLWGWASDACTRDECIYKIVARPILAGEGLGLAPRGWLPAPGYPYLLALCGWLFGNFEAVKWVQTALAAPTLAALFRTTDRVSGRASARWMGWLFAVHPTFVFFAGTMWTETLYTFLLSVAVLATLWARDEGPGRAALPGALVGLTVLTRGVATYMAPLFLLALLAPDDGVTSVARWRSALQARARHAAAFVVALVLTVAPYSVSASLRWGGPVISDATLGHVIALGNDDYPPVTFDYQIGQLTGRLYAKTLSKGRRDCPRRGGPLAADQCEVDRAVAWIADHPTEFVSRIPLRLAQLFNPHSFLTRHIRWGFWPGLPWALKELLVTYQMLFTFAVVGLGTVAAWARARGPYGLLAVSVVLYNVAVISVLYGLTRFRLPLEPLWMVFLASALAAPRASWAALRGSAGRLAGALVTLPIVLALLLRYAWTGYPVP